MELRKGYKRTEVGDIPNDWQLGTLDEISKKIGSGITPKGGSTVYQSFGHPLIRSQNVGWGNLKLDDVAYISDAIHQTFSNTELMPMDVLLNISGASIGRSAVVDDTIVGGNVNQHVCIIRPNEDSLDPFYLSKFLLSSIGQNQIYSFQSSGNREGLNFGQIKSFQIPLPPLTEQKAIARVLSDTDTLIQALQNKINKKRNIKQGAMQQLLKPKEGWEKKKIKEVVSINTGSKNTQDKLNDGAYPFFVRSQTVERIDSFSFDCEAILTAGDGVGTGKIFHYINGKFEVHQRVYVMSNFDDNLYGYYFYLFFKNNFYDRIIQMTAKSSVDSVRREMIADMEIPLPKLIEQKRIATILSDMNTEIDQLEEKLSKYKKIKQGMMQNLLTGKIRLV